MHMDVSLSSETSDGHNNGSKIKTKHVVICVLVDVRVHTTAKCGTSGAGIVGEASSADDG